jgi:hypothetical protein
MSYKKETDLIFIKWFLFLISILIIFFFLIKFNFISSLLKNDVSFISPLILLIFAIFTIKTGIEVFYLKDTYCNLLILDNYIVNNKEKSTEAVNIIKSSQKHLDKCVCEHFLSLSYINNNKDINLVTNKKELCKIFEYKLTKGLDLGWFIVDLLLKLGLIGTVIGFILMLASITIIENFDLTMMQDLLQKMSGGMKVALYTTLTGLITSILLSFQYKFLENKIFDIISLINKFTELHAPIIADITNEIQKTK